MLGSLRPDPRGEGPLDRKRTLGPEFVIAFQHLDQVTGCFI